MSFVKIQAVSLPLTLLHAESCVAMATTSLVLCHSSLRFFTSERPPILHKVATIQWRSTVSFLPPSLSLCRNFEKLRFRPRRGSSPCVRVSGFFPRSGRCRGEPTAGLRVEKCGHATAEYFLSVFLTPTDAQRRLDSFLRRCLPNRREKKLSESRLTLRALLSSKKINH